MPEPGTLQYKAHWEAHRMSARTNAVGSSAEDRRHREVGMLHWALAIIAVTVGIFDGGGSSSATSHGFLQEVHPLFGLLLLALVFSQFYWRSKYSQAARPSDLRVFSRRLVRVVFLLVYIVILAKVALLHLGPVSSSAGGVGNHLGGYVACGAGALLTIRFLAGLARRT
jgi:cytochrome b561